MLTMSRAPVLLLVKPPRSSRLRRNMRARLAAAIARLPGALGWDGRSMTPPEPKSVSPPSRLLTSAGVNRLGLGAGGGGGRVVERSEFKRRTLSWILVAPSYVA